MSAFDRLFVAVAFLVYFVAGCIGAQLIIKALIQ